VRKLVAVLLLAVGVLVGYWFHSVPVKAQVPSSDFFAFNIGGSVRLSVDLPESELTCKVTQVANGFVGCARDDQKRQAERWINLRFVKVITPLER